MTILISVLVAVVMYYIGFLAGGLNSDNKCEDEITELKKEIKWWNRQCKLLSDENTVLKQQTIKKREKKKNSIADKNEAGIRELFNEGLSDKQIADILNCSKSTIQRAVKKWGLR